MNWAARKPKPPSPNAIRTNNSAEFDAIIAREKAGEFKVYALTSLATKGGKSNGAWEFAVRFNENEERKLE